MKSGGRRAGPATAYAYAALGRSVYLLWGCKADGAPATVAEFCADHPRRVRLDRGGAAQLRAASAAEAADAGVPLNPRLLVVAGVEASEVPGGRDLLSLWLLLEAPSAGVCAAWAAAGSTLLSPWRDVLKPAAGTGGGGSTATATAAASAVQWLRVPAGAHPLAAATGATGIAASARWGARGRRGILVASNWLKAPGAVASAVGALGKTADGVDQFTGMPVAGVALTLGLFAVQAMALVVLASEHGAVRVNAADQCESILKSAVEHTAKALARQPTAFMEPHVEQLCDLLGRVEAVLGGVEASFFARPVAAALQAEAVGGWSVELDRLRAELLALRSEGAIADEVYATHRKISDLHKSLVHPAPPSQDDWDAAYDLRDPDDGYVAGLSTPGRAEHAILGALKEYVVGGAVQAPRVGVSGIGGSGKSTACAGVATSEFVRKHFSRGTVWVQLGDASTPKTAVDAVLELVHRLCGAEIYHRLRKVKVIKDLLAVAARYTQLVPVAEASDWMVVIDDVHYNKRDLLRQLLRAVPRATPVLFTTRVESVKSLVDAQQVTIDALPEKDARLLLAKAMGRVLVADVVPFSPLEDAAWVDQLMQKTKRHALSLSIFGNLVRERDGAWRDVWDVYSERLMEIDFSPSDGGMGLQPSVRATLYTSLALLADDTSRSAFADLGILPTSIKVGVHVLARLWRPLVEARAVANPARTASSGGGGGAAARIHVVKLVDVLFRAGLVRRVVDASMGMVEGVIVHPVIGAYAASLLADVYRATHSRLLHDYTLGVENRHSEEEHGRVYPFWESLDHDDGYWFNNVARHAASCGNVSALVSLVDPRWGPVRVRTCSPFAYQEDVEVVLASLLPCVQDVNNKMHQTPTMLARAYGALAFAYKDRIAGERAANVDASIAWHNRELGLWTPEAAPRDWATAQNNLGVSYSDRVSGDRAANVEEAIACYERALQVRTREGAPREWAMTQNNLGIAYSNRVDGDRAANMEVAISCYERSLEVTRREAEPLYWAATQSNLGNAYSSRLRGVLSANTEAAIACFQRALEECTQEAAPLKWAMTQINLGAVYSSRKDGDREDNMEAAIMCYERALQVHTREATPFDWATGQHNLGNAYYGRVFGVKEENMEAAIACFERALEVRTREAAPRDMASTQNCLGAAYDARVSGHRAANIRKAIECYERALEIWTREAAPQEWAKTQNNLGNAYSDDAGGVDVVAWEEAIVCYGRALQVRTREAAPLDWAMTQSNLGVAHVKREAGERAANVEAAIGYFVNALTVLTREAVPRDWAMTQYRMGGAYSVRMSGERAANLEVAVACYERALQEWTQGAAPLQWAITQCSPGNAYTSRIDGDEASNIEAAIACYKRALEVQTRGAAPRAWGTLQQKLGAAFSVRPSGDVGANVEEAIACLVRAQEVLVRPAVPFAWAMTQFRLGGLYCKRVSGDRAANMEAAIASYKRALEEWTREAAPTQWALTQHAMGDAFAARVHGDRETNVDAAIACYELSAQVDV